MKTLPIRFRVTGEERAVLLAAAKRRRISMSELIRIDAVAPLLDAARAQRARGGE